MTAVVFNFRQFESARNQARRLDLDTDSYRSAVRQIVTEQAAGGTGVHVAGEMSARRRDAGSTDPNRPEAA